MSRYRCPQCGATHKHEVHKCRLCGYDMTGEIQEMPRPDQREKVSHRRRGGLGSLALYGIIGVVLLAAIALLVGVRGTDATWDDIARYVPGIDPRVDDGWRTLSDPDAGFSVEMPGTTTEETAPFDAVEGGELTVWTAAPAEDTVITLGYGTLAEPFPTASIRGPTEELARQWASAIPARVGSVDETGVQGHVAMSAELRNVELDEQPGRGHAVVWVRDDVFWTVTIETLRGPRSSLPEEQLGRILRSFRYEVPEDAETPGDGGSDAAGAEDPDGAEDPEDADGEDGEDGS